MHTKFQVQRLPGSRTASFRLNPILWGGSGDPNFSVHISSRWIEISLRTKYPLPRFPGSRTASFRLNPTLFLCLEKQKTTKKQNSVELESSLAPAEAKVGAVAKLTDK